MALGNNLKGIKKDSLIPEKKTKKKDTSKATVKSKPKTKATIKAKPLVKKGIAKPKARKTIKPTAPNPKKVGKKEVANKSVVANSPKQVANLDEKILVGSENGAHITAKLIPSRRKTVRKTKLIFEGSLSSLEGKSIKKCLLTTFSNYDIIDIQLKNITHLDITPIQMIQLFIKFYQDKKVTVDSDLPFDMKIVVERAGFGLLMFKEEAA